jgi:hypothetical protein
VQVLGHLEERLGPFRVGFVGHVAQGQVATRRHRVPELPHNRPWVFFIPQAVQDAGEYDPDWLSEVQRVTYLRVVEHLLWLAKIRPKRDDVGASHQRGGMGGDHRINVDVNDARLGRHPVRDLVSISHARQPRAKVQELADALAEHVVHHPLQQVTALNGGVGGERYAYLHGHRLYRLGRPPVDREVVLAPQVIVPDAGRVGIPDADRIMGLRLGGCWRHGGH